MVNVTIEPSIERGIDSTWREHEGKYKDNPRRRELLPEHYTQSTPPAFGQAHADDFHFRRKIALQDVRGGMKMQRGGDQINQRRGWLEFQAREITVTRKVSLGLMPADARPIVRGLHRQIHVLRGFEFQNRQAFRARDAQQVQNAVL